MNRSILTSVCLTVPFLYGGSALADIPAPQTEVVPPNETTGSESQSWMTTVAGGLLVCAFIAVVIVRLRRGRQQETQANSPADKG